MTCPQTSRKHRSAPICTANKSATVHALCSWVRWQGDKVPARLCLVSQHHHSDALQTCTIGAALTWRQRSLPHCSMREVCCSGAGIWRLAAAWTTCMRSCTSSTLLPLRSVLVLQHPLSLLTSAPECKSVVQLRRQTLVCRHTCMACNQATKLDMPQRRYMGRMAWGRLQWGDTLADTPGDCPAA